MNERVPQRPLYSRALRLRHTNPGAVVCFGLFEGSITVSILMALTEKVSWWVVVLLPATVALTVKLNDMVAGAMKGNR